MPAAATLGQCPDAPEHVVDEPGLLRHRRIPRRREREIDRHQAVGAEAQIDPLEPLEGLHHQSAADQEGGGNGNLGDHQRREGTPSAAARWSRCLTREMSCADRATLSAGSKPEDGPGEDRDRERERQHLPVDPEVGEVRTQAGCLDGVERREHRPGPVREQHAGGAAEEGQEQALGEKLPDQPAARGAERAPDGDLPFARHSAGEQQAGHVRAADEQDEPDRHSDDAEGPLGPAVQVREELLPERDDPVRPPAPRRMPGPEDCAPRSRGGRHRCR